MPRGKLARRLLDIHRKHGADPNVGERIGDLVRGVSGKGRRKLWDSVRGDRLDARFRGVARARLGVEMEEVTTFFIDFETELDDDQKRWFDVGYNFEVERLNSDFLTAVDDLYTTIGNSMTLKSFCKKCGMAKRMGEKFMMYKHLSKNGWLLIMNLKFVSEDYQMIRGDPFTKLLFDQGPIKFRPTDKENFDSDITASIQKYKIKNQTIARYIEGYKKYYDASLKFEELTDMIPQLFATFKNVESTFSGDGSNEEGIERPDDGEGGRGDDAGISDDDDSEDVPKYRGGGDQEAEEDSPDDTGFGFKSFSKRRPGEWEYEIKEPAYRGGKDDEVYEKVIIQTPSGPQWADSVYELVHKYNSVHKSDDFKMYEKYWNNYVLPTFELRDKSKKVDIPGSDSSSEDGSEDEGEGDDVDGVDGQSGGGGVKKTDGGRVDGSDVDGQTRDGEESDDDVTASGRETGIV